MELWIGAEFSGGIHADIRGARNFLEDEINNEIKGQDYDLELESWDCIAIIMEDDDYDEIVKHSKKKKDMDFRLKINHKEFVNSSPLDKQTLFYELLLRSLDLLEEKGLNQKGLCKLRQDMNVVANKNGWV